MSLTLVLCKHSMLTVYHTVLYWELNMHHLWRHCWQRTNSANSRQNICQGLYAISFLQWWY